jgi:hypothetical protein
MYENEVSASPLRSLFLAHNHIQKQRIPLVCVQPPIKTSQRRYWQTTNPSLKRKVTANAVYLQMGHVYPSLFAQQPPHQCHGADILWKRKQFSFGIILNYKQDSESLGIWTSPNVRNYKWLENTTFRELETALINQMYDYKCRTMDLFKVRTAMTSATKLLDLLFP